MPRAASVAMTARTVRASTLVVCAILFSTATAGAQVAFDEAIRNLGSPQPEVRMGTLRLLKDAGYVEAARPVAALLTDEIDAIQLEAIATELNIFLAEKVSSRRRVALIVEVRDRVAAQPAFEAGPLALGASAIPMEVVAGLRQATQDENPGVSLEALYALGVLGSEVSGSERRELLRTAGPQLAALLGVPDAPRRVAAARVMGRLFARRPGDDPVPEAVGDPLIVALNDSEDSVRAVAMETLGSMRYDRAVQALTQLMDFYLRGPMAERALRALAQIGHPSSVERFMVQLTVGSTALRVSAIEGLARIGSSAAWPTVQRTAENDRSEQVALAAAFAAVTLSQASLDPIFDALVRPRVSGQALGYLIELAPGRSQALVRYLQSPEAQIRTDAAYALGLSADRGAIPALDALKADPDPQVVRAAARAILRLRTN